jgi:N-acetylmuramoyl-L-alanine amidase
MKITNFAILIAVLTAAILILPAIAVGQSDDGFDFTDAVRDAPQSETSPVEPEPDVVSTAPNEFNGLIVCLDPGHPSEVTDGMAEQNGVTENHINWIVANSIADMLRAEGINVILTKATETELVTNAERAQIANDAGATLMLRIHCDTGSETAHGMTFYYPDRQGEWEGHVGPSLELLPRCRDAATIIHDIATDELGGLIYDRGIKTDMDTMIGAQQGGALRASILSQVPIVLVEMCFLSNPGDAAIIADADKRLQVVEALAAGIKAYIRSVVG